MKTALNILVFLSICVFGMTQSQAKNGSIESHNLVSIRTIGHEVLLSVGDSTSRVLPVQRVNEKYRIDFDTEFGFDPDDLGNTINSVVGKHEISKHYIVEVVSCMSNEVVYSYEIGNAEQAMVPCKGRLQPEGCYAILISLLDFKTGAAEGSVQKAQMFSLSSSLWNILIGVLAVVLSGAIAFFWTKRQKSGQNADLISIGAYKFDQRNLELLHNEERVELTGKEGDLLFLLYNSANSTVEREVILKNVWGNDSDYIGRTLDVFISKLRKKLEADENIKIINIRGVGYKLILNG
jgi:hypothetical protein